MGRRRERARGRPTAARRRPHLGAGKPRHCPLRHPVRRQLPRPTVPASFSACPARRSRATGQLESTASRSTTPPPNRGCRSRVDWRTHAIGRQQQDPESTLALVTTALETRCCCGRTRSRPERRRLARRVRELADLRTERELLRRRPDWDRTGAAASRSGAAQRRTAGRGRLAAAEQRRLVLRQSFRGRPRSRHPRCAITCSCYQRPERPLVIAQRDHVAAAD